ARPQIGQLDVDDWRHVHGSAGRHPPVDRRITAGRREPVDGDRRPERDPRPAQPHRRPTAEAPVTSAVEKLQQSHLSDQTELLADDLTIDTLYLWQDGR